MSRASKYRTRKQYSKVWMTRWQVFVMFWVSVYLVADIYCNQALNAVTIVNSLVISIVAVMVPYFAKSYFETKQEERTRLQEQKMEHDDAVG